MGAQLHIGEVARLVGISTKTIRHYHKVGLLAEPERTASDYRLYTAADLLQLVRIRRLQALGLSLAQIARVLGAPDRAQTLRGALVALADDLDAQIAVLQARRERVQRFLAEDRMDIDQPTTPPTILAQAHAQLGAAPEISATLWQQDMQIFGMLEAIALPGDVQGQMATVVETMTRDPATYARMLALAEQLAALAPLPADDPAVERLAAEARAAGWLTDLQAFFPTDMPTLEAPFDAILGEIMLSALAPAQRRFLDLVRAEESP